MKARILIGTFVLILILAAMPNAMAGDLTISDVTYTPQYPQQGDTIHLKAKVTSSSDVSYVRAFPCWEQPSYTCGMPVSMTDADSDGYYETDLSHEDWTNGNIIHINISAKDTSGDDQKTYTIPPFKIGESGNGGPKDPEDYTNEGDCKNAGYYWWDDVCHDRAKLPSDFIDETSCEAGGHYWWDSKCNAEAGTPDKYKTKDDCKAIGYFWYSDKCHEKKEDKPEPGFIPGFEVAVAAMAVLTVSALVMRRRQSS